MAAQAGEDVINAQGAGDQGMMFGYACNETPDLMPLPIWTAHRLAERLAEVRKSGQVPYLRPDGKTQVTYEYEDGRRSALKSVLISTQHQDGIDRDSVIRPDLIEQVIRPIVPEQFADDDYDVYVNPTGNFVIGGPHGDCGLTGRKIIVDTYGGMGRHGGGAFSGKDPSKVDRSAAYATRWVAKHVVASGAADRCELQVAYAIGMAHPLSILVETFGTNHVDEAKIEASGTRGVRPASRCDRPRSRSEEARSTSASAAYGHFGRSGFTWEDTEPARRLQGRCRALIPVLSLTAGHLAATCRSARRRTDTPPGDRRPRPSRRHGTRQAVRLSRSRRARRERDRRVDRPRRTARPTSRGLGRRSSTRPTRSTRTG